MAGFLGNQPPKVPLTSADIANGTVTADDLNSTLNLSSKTVTLPASSVTSHVTSFDDSDIRSDILKLALHQAIDGNRAAYNLEDSFIDGFEDDTGITTETNVDRNTSGEYISSISSDHGVTMGYQHNLSNSLTPTTNTLSAGTIALNSGAFTASGKTGYGVQMPNTRSSTSQGITLAGMSSATRSWCFWFKITGNTDGYVADFRGHGGGGHDAFTSSDYVNGGAGNATAYGSLATGVWHHGVVIDASTGITLMSRYAAEGSPSTWVSNGVILDNLEIFDGTISSSQVAAVYGYTGLLGTTTNATGTLISDPQTASTSRTSCSGVIIYSDADGTNTLGTDLKIYFSCNNSAWTEASSYGTATTYSGTKKLVKLGATTCTAGTSVAMKAVWANQASTVAGTQSLIAQNTGTAIGNMTEQGGLAASFNGNKNQAYAQNSVADNGNGPGYVGKDWGSGNTKKVSGVKIWGSNETGYGGTGHATSFFLYGSNTAPTGVTDGTLIKTLATSQSDVNSTNPLEYLTGIDTTTAYRYHWFAITTPTNTTGQVILCELEFYELTGAVTGKEARLHGWAVNY